MTILWCYRNLKRCLYLAKNALKCNDWRVKFQKFSESNSPRSPIWAWATASIPKSTPQSQPPTVSIGFTSNPDSQRITHHVQYLVHQTLEINVIISPISYYIEVMSRYHMTVVKVLQNSSHYQSRVNQLTPKKQDSTCSQNEFQTPDF